MSCGLSRSSYTKRLHLEPLEHRCLLATTPIPAGGYIVGSPSTPASDLAYDQYLVELINRARANPTAEATRFGITLNQGIAPNSITSSPKQPLAPHQALRTAALNHSIQMLQQNYFSHQAPNGSWPWDRAQAAGYPSGWIGENIAWSSVSGSQAVEDAIAARHRQLFLSTSGHRENLLSPDWNDGGMGVLFGKSPYQSISTPGINISLVTELFGRQSNVRYLTGVAYTDAIVDDDFYNIGEGLSGVTFTASAGSQTYSVQTNVAGAYALALPSGTYTVTASGGGLSAPLAFQNVVIGTENVKLDAVSAPAAPAPVIGESGLLTLEQPHADYWQRVTLQRTYQNPVVIVGPLSYAGGQAATVRVRSVTTTSFEWQVDEWDYLDAAHAAETAGYLVVEAGVHTLSDGTRLVAGVTSTGDAWRSVSLSDFSATPVVLAQAASRNEASAVVTRLKNVSATGFEVRLQEEEASNGLHAAESVHYVAVQPGAGTSDGTQYQATTTPSTVDHRPSRYQFQQTFAATPILLAQMQTFNGWDTAGMRITSINNSRVDFLLQEEQSLDSEMLHIGESVGFLALAAGLLRGESAVVVPPQAVGESGIVTAGQATLDQWHTVTFARSYANPVVVMGPVTLNGLQQTTVRVRNVTPTGFQWQLDEWDYLDEIHADETVSYLVVDAGTYTLSNGTRLIAGLTSASDQWKTVTHPALSATPVVLTQVTSRNESSAVVTRQQNVTTTGFQVRVQEEEANDGIHAAETIAYVAMEPGSGQSHGIDFLATRVPNVDWRQVSLSFGSRFAAAPAFLANMQTQAGLDPAALRTRAVTAQGTDLFIDEEQSFDTERLHVAETVGFLAVAPGLLNGTSGLALAAIHRPGSPPAPQSPPAPPSAARDRDDLLWVTAAAIPTASDRTLTTEPIRPAKPSPDGEPPGDLSIGYDRTIGAVLRSERLSQNQLRPLSGEETSTAESDCRECDPSESAAPDRSAPASLQLSRAAVDQLFGV